MANKASGQDDGTKKAGPAGQKSGRLIAWYIRFVFKTSRVVCEPDNIEQILTDNHPLVFATWHGQFLLLSNLKPKSTPVAVMVARHGDAELIGQAYAALGLDLVRGAGAGFRKRDRGGFAAFKGALGALKRGTSLVMTADVPPGPARIAGPGIIKIAQYSGRPIIPAAIASRRFFTLSNWSRFTINLPFGRVGAVLGAPLHVSRTAEPDQLERDRLALEQALNAATQRAYQLAGGDLQRALPLWKRAPSRPGGVLRFYLWLTRGGGLYSRFIMPWRLKQGKELPERVSERLGEAARPRPPGELIWIHAASVGETNSVLPIIKALRARRPALSILLTTGTVTSARLATDRLQQLASQPPADATAAGGALIHHFVPYDAARFVRRFLEHWQPDLAGFVESEIWPNLILQTAARDVPIVLLNGRMSKASFRNWRRFSRASHAIFARIRLVLAQNDVYGHRFQSLGVRRAVTVGNLKLDAPPPPFDPAELAQFRDQIGQRPVLLAASTHKGEDEAVISAHKQLKQQFPDLLTIIVPRHPERASDIAGIITTNTLTGLCRSVHKLPEPDCDIYIADSIGELGLFYRLADVAFIGGSLIPHGGQNPIEAVKCGVAVLTGPHVHNFLDIYHLLEQADAVETVTDGDGLAHAARALLQDKELAATRVRAGMAALAAGSGGLARTLDELIGLLDETQAATRAATASAQSRQNSAGKPPITGSITHPDGQQPD